MYHFIFYFIYRAKLKTDGPATTRYSANIIVTIFVLIHLVFLYSILRFFCYYFFQLSIARSNVHATFKDNFIYIAIAIITFLFSYRYFSDFKQAVEDHGIWDYKRNLNYIYGVAATFDKTYSTYGIRTEFVFKGYSMTAEDFGNFHYGVVGLANGNFAKAMLFAAAGYVQIRDGNSRPEWQNTTYWGDDPNDHYWIQQGFNYYHSNY